LRGAAEEHKIEFKVDLPLLEIKEHKNENNPTVLNIISSEFMVEEKNKEEEHKIPLVSNKIEQKIPLNSTKEQHRLPTIMNIESFECYNRSPKLSSNTTELRLNLMPMSINRCEQKHGSLKSRNARYSDNDTHFCSKVYEVPSINSSKVSDCSVSVKDINTHDSIPLNTHSTQSLMSVSAVSNSCSMNSVSIVTVSTVRSKANKKHNRNIRSLILRNEGRSNEFKISLKAI